MVLLKKTTLFAIVFALAANTAQAAVINKRHGHEQQQQSGGDCGCVDVSREHLALYEISLTQI